MISFWLVTCYHTQTLYKTAEKVTVIRFFTQTSVRDTPFDQHYHDYAKYCDRKTCNLAVMTETKLDTRLTQLGTVWQGPY